MSAHTTRNASERVGKILEMPPGRPQHCSQPSLFPASLSPFPDINIIIAPTPATGTPIKNGLENHRNPSNGPGTPLEPRWNTSGTPQETSFQARRGCSAFCPGSRKAFLGAGGRAYALWTQALPASMLTCERTRSL